jgi:hypothetical protein
VISAAMAIRRRYRGDARAVFARDDARGLRWGERRDRSRPSASPVTAAVRPGGLPPRALGSPWPVGSTEEFLPVCGVIGLGRLLAEGDRVVLDELRGHASDSRWRVREAAAIALQRCGDTDFPALLAAMQAWASGTALERRAAVAALCEPRLIVQHENARDVLALLERVTAELPALDRRREGFETLRQALGSAWSVAVVPLPHEGKPRFERLLASDDSDIRWLARENLRKKRLVRMDRDWVEKARARTRRP